MLVREAHEVAGEGHESGGRVTLIVPTYILKRLQRIDKSEAKHRAAREAKRSGSFTREQWQATLEYHGHHCAYCLRSGVKLEADHVVALFRGGAHCADNIVPACVRCNRGKKDRPVFTMVNR